MFLVEISVMLCFFDGYFDFFIVCSCLDFERFFSCPVMEFVSVSSEEDFCMCTSRNSIISITSEELSYTLDILSFCEDFCELDECIASIFVDVDS